MWCVVCEVPLDAHYSHVYNDKLGVAQYKPTAQYCKKCGLMYIYDEEKLDRSPDEQI